MENLGNCNIKNFQHSEIIPVIMYIFNLFCLFMRILFFYDYDEINILEKNTYYQSR